MTGPRVVALGGGHGLAASLEALRLVTNHVVAVVTVADDGGSSGRLRAEFNVLPPGDLRMALAALCDDGPWGQTWRDVLQHRFGGNGPLAGHSLGNLLIVGLWDQLADPVSGLDLVGRLLNSHGRVLPMAAEPLEIEADIAGHDPEHPHDRVTIRGQHKVAASNGRVEAVRLLPGQPATCPEVVEAIHDAHWVVLGPGSWFTSVLPHVLVPGVREALVTTPARRLLTLNLEVNSGETKGYRAADHLQSLAEHAPELRLDIVLVDPSVLRCGDNDERELSSAAASLGARVVTAPVAATARSGQHDSLRLAAAYRDLLS
ncbi:MAG: hypothetical protein CSA84_01570 [Actinomycetales bacterium]|nr:MAG: hypothetical protein CSA84_01570 [Actinomycetales bacterium]